MARSALFGAVAVFGLAISTQTLAASPFGIQEGSPRVGVAADREACAAQSGLAWCNPSEAGAIGVVSMSRAEVVAVDMKLRANFHYQLSMKGGWRSYYDQATTQRGWTADCDGLTFTVLDALVRAGFPQDHMWRAIVIQADNKFSGVKHMVAVVEVEGKFWVIGDASARPYLLSEAEFTPYLFARVSDGTVWRRATPKKPVDVKVTQVAAAN